MKIVAAVTLIVCACNTASQEAAQDGGSGDDGKADGNGTSQGGGVALLGPGGRCLDTQGHDGNPVYLWQCNGTAAQQWKLQPDGSIVNATGMCLDARGGATADGTPIQLSDCNGRDGQRWTYSVDRQLIGTGGRCLDAIGGSSADGTRIQLYDCNGTAAQAWTVSEKLRTDVFLIEQLGVCIAGNSCPATPPTAGCLPIYDGSGSVSTSYAIDQHLSITPYDASAPAGATCLQLTMSSEDVATLQQEAQQFATNVETWSHGALDLEVHVHVLPTVSSSLAVYGHSLWPAPWDLDQFLRPSLTSQTSFVMVSSGLRDPSGLHTQVGACGLSYGASIGVAGAGYSWIPRTGNVASFECGNHGPYEIEWMHQLQFAAKRLSGFNDLYPTTFPACGHGDPDPLRWFPDPDPNITKDPDSPFCGQNGSSIANDPAIQHVLETHWPAIRRFVANHCRDGVQDYGETGVDSGGNCLP
jgi:hypothetical protein